jgi:hypothetical protein
LNADVAIAVIGEPDYDGKRRSRNVVSRAGLNVIRRVRKCDSMERLVW